MNAVSGSVAPWKTSGVQVWNGTRLSLKAMPIRNIPAPTQKSGDVTSEGSANAERVTLPVAPKSNAKPKIKNAVAVELRIKYFSADSRAARRSTAPQSA